MSSDHSSLLKGVYDVFSGTVAVMFLSLSHMSLAAHVSGC